MKLIDDPGIRCGQCAHAKAFLCGPTEYQKKAAEWAFKLNQMRGACHDSHDFADCAKGKRLPSSGECALFAEK